MRYHDICRTWWPLLQAICVNFKSFSTVPLSSRMSLGSWFCIEPDICRTICGTLMHSFFYSQPRLYFRLLSLKRLFYLWAAGVLSLFDLYSLSHVFWSCILATMMPNKIFHVVERKTMLTSLENLPLSVHLYYCVGIHELQLVPLASWSGSCSD